MMDDDVLVEMDDQLAPHALASNCITICFILDATYLLCLVSPAKQQLRCNEEAKYTLTGPNSYVFLWLD